MTARRIRSTLVARLDRFHAETGGTVLAWGGATTGTVRKENGYFKFDVASVPDVTVPTKVEFHFYVSATNYPRRN